MTTNPKKTFTLHVEPRHFEGATQGNTHDCGVARAAREYGLQLKVSPEAGGFVFWTDNSDKFIKISSCHKTQVVTWDIFGIIPPPFTLELPVSLLEDALIPVTA